MDDRGQLFYNRIIKMAETSKKNEFLKELENNKIRKNTECLISKNFDAFDTQYYNSSEAMRLGEGCLLYGVLSSCKKEVQCQRKRKI